MNARLVPVPSLTPIQRQSMLRLLEDHFEQVSADQFEDDLVAKNWAVLIEDAGGNLQGFSTIRFDRSRYEGRAVNVVCSGDTIVDRSAWGSWALFRCWVASVHRLHATSPDGPLLWLLLVSGFRTYRLLPLFWRSFVPSPGAATAPATRRLLDHLAGERFGRDYDAASGIVRFPRPQVLRADLREIPAARLSDRHVAFFADRNPGHGRGDELVCLTDLSAGNLTAAGRRMLGADACRPVPGGR